MDERTKRKREIKLANTPESEAAFPKPQPPNDKQLYVLVIDERKDPAINVLLSRKEDVLMKEDLNDYLFNAQIFNAADLKRWIKDVGLAKEEGGAGALQKGNIVSLRAIITKEDTVIFERLTWEEIKPISSSPILNKK